MPSSYLFITISDVNGLRNKSTKTQIRKHAMKDIGFSRRRPVDDSDSEPRSSELRIPNEHARGNQNVPDPNKAEESDRKDHLPLLDDRASYSSCIPCPLDAACARLDNESVDLLKYFAYYSSYMPTRFEFTNAVDCIRRALRDDLVLSCLLSAAASRARYVHGLQVVHFNRKEVACTQQGLETLQERLKDVGNELSENVMRLIAGILYLGAGALYRDDLVVAKIHIRFAIKLAELRGGVVNIPDARLLNSVLGLDDALSCREWIPCAVRCTFDPGPFAHAQPERKDEQVGDEHCSAALLLSKHETFVPDSLRQLIWQILGTLRIRCKLEKATDIFSAQFLAERQWLALRTLAIRNRLLALDSTAATTNAVRMSLVLFTLLPPGDSRPGRTAELVAKRLKSVLSRSSRSQWLSCEDLRFWCLLLGYFSVFQNSDESTETWFNEEIWKMIAGGKAKPGASPSKADLVEELINFQRQCLFHDCRQRPMTERLANSLWQRFQGDLAKSDGPPHRTLT